VSVDPSRSPQGRAAVGPAALPEVRAQAGRLVPHGAGERLAHEAEAYLAAVDFFRAEGFEPRWRNDEAAISPVSPHALDGTGKLSVTGEGIEG